MTDKVPERIWVDMPNVLWHGDMKHDAGRVKGGTEYILKSVHIDIRNEWFKKGLKAGKISNNSSGCCCVFEDDGETITNICAPHKDMIDKAKKEGVERERD